MQFINSKKNLYLFAIFTVLPCLFLYSCIIYSGAGVNGGSVLALALMWVPGLAALATKLTIDHSVRGIGWRIHKNSLPSFAAAYLIPFGLCLVVYGLAWLTGLGRRGESSFPQYATFATLGVLLSMAASLGEEIGWRGFLLTELLRLFPENTVHLIIGIVWFFYHAPLIVFSNYNNGNVPLSLLCFFVMVMGFTVLADHLCIRAQSLWPAVLLHASHNVFVQSIFDRLTVNGPYTQYLTSEFGAGLAIGYALIALFICRHCQQGALLRHSGK